MAQHKSGQTHMGLTDALHLARTRRPLGRSFAPRRRRLGQAAASAYMVSMAILKIARMGHPVLVRPAQPIDDPSAEPVQRLIADMAETMVDAEGIGLAAPQVHRSLRLILFFDAEERDEAAGPPADRADQSGDRAARRRPRAGLGRLPLDPRAARRWCRATRASATAALTPDGRDRRARGAAACTPGWSSTRSTIWTACCTRCACPICASSTFETELKHFARRDPTRGSRMSQPTSREEQRDRLLEAALRARAVRRLEPALAARRRRRSRPRAGPRAPAVPARRRRSAGPCRALGRSADAGAGRPARGSARARSDRAAGARPPGGAGPAPRGDAPGDRGPDAARATASPPAAACGARSI